jgi:hypothetical protein
MLAGKDVPPDDFFLGLIRFFQGLADFHEAEGRELREEFGEGPWSIDRGPEKIALGIQDWWLGRPEDQTWEPDDGDDAT